MAKDDYHVIVYQILAYLYQCLKNDKPVDVNLLRNDNKVYFDINKLYWNYIICNMQDYGFITGVAISYIDNEKPIVSSLEGCQITPLGIEYLCDNSFMEKAKRFLKDIKEITPFI